MLCLRADSESPTDKFKFIGTLVGAYATSNGGAGKTESYISRWRYQGKGQDIGNGESVPYTPFVV